MKAYVWAKTWDGLSSNQKFILLMIADHYNDEKKRAWPSIATLAHETGMSVSTVTRCLRALETIGLIETETWVKAGTNERMSNRYCLPWYDPKSERRAAPVAVTAGFDVHGEYVLEEVEA